MTQGPPDRLFIESFQGPNCRAEVYEIAGRDGAGIEKVEYEVLFNGERHPRPSMGEASVLASELSGDTRFLDASRRQRA